VAVIRSQRVRALALSSVGFSQGSRVRRRAGRIERQSREPIEVARRSVPKTKAEPGATGQKELIALQDGALERQDRRFFRVKKVPCHGERGAPSPSIGEPECRRRSGGALCRNKLRSGRRKPAPRNFRTRARTSRRRYIRSTATSWPRVVADAVRTATTIS